MSRKKMPCPCKRLGCVSEVVGVARRPRVTCVRVKSACGMAYNQRATDAFASDDEAERHGFRIMYETGERFPNLKAVIKRRV